MDNIAKQEGCKVETYNYVSDFQLLALKDKRGILKNAKTLLRIQQENEKLVKTGHTKMRCY